MNVFDKVTEWISKITNILLSLLILGIVINILFPGYGQIRVIEGIGNVMQTFGDNGLAGLLALILIVIWYQKK